MTLFWLVQKSSLKKILYELLRWVEMVDGICIFFTRKHDALGSKPVSIEKRRKKNNFDRNLWIAHSISFKLKISKR